MANEEHGNVDVIIGNIGVSEWQTSIAGAVNETYSFANSTLFIANIAGYYRDYAFRYIRPACQWLDGFVPSIHNLGTGIMSTRIATKLISGLTKQICGERLIFKLKSEKTPENLAALRFISDWYQKQKIHKAVKNGIGFAFGLGTSLLKINKRANGDLWWEPVRFDNCFFLSSFTGELREATFLIRGYTDTREGHDRCQYFLCEHRFWKEYQPEIKKVKKPDGSIGYETIHKKGDKDPVVEYTVHRATSQSLQNLMASQTNRSSVNWEEIPNDIRKLIKSDYGTIRIGEPQKIGLTNLGVVSLINGEGDISVPTGANFGESMIIGIQDDLITYEVASSYLLRDMCNGKGTIYLPKSLSIGDVNTPIEIASGSGENGAPLGNGESGMVNTPVAPYIPPATSPYSGVPDRIETLKGVNPEDQQAIVQQFEVRAAEWQIIKENCLKNIAVKWGMSPKILSSFLAQGNAQMTATQVDSEDDISIAFINLHRSYFIDALNELLEIVLNYYGYDANIEIRFASPSLVNKDRLLERTLKKLEAGLIDLEEAIREINPDLDEEALQTQIDAALKAKQEMMLQAMNQFNAEGGFGPEEPIGFDTDILKGASVPR